MLYRIVTSRFRSGQIEVEDDVVVRATPSFLWAIGKDVDIVRAWAGEKGLLWHETNFPSSKLQNLPSDQQILKKVTP